MGKRVCRSQYLCYLSNGHWVRCALWGRVTVYLISAPRFHACNRLVVSWYPERPSSKAKIEIMLWRVCQFWLYFQELQLAGTGRLPNYELLEWAHLSSITWAETMSPCSRTIDLERAIFEVWRVEMVSLTLAISSLQATPNKWYIAVLIFLLFLWANSEPAWSKSSICVCCCCEGVGFRGCDVISKGKGCLGSGLSQCGRVLCGCYGCVWMVFVREYNVCRSDCAWVFNAAWIDWAHVIKVLRFKY